MTGSISMASDIVDGRIVVIFNDEMEGSLPLVVVPSLTCPMEEASPKGANSEIIT
jgi:hypothetical protein